MSGAAFERDDGDWVLELELPDVLRLEYKLEVDHADGGTRVDLRPRQPEARAGRVRREVGARAARLRAAGVAGGRGVPGRFDEVVDPRAAGSGANVAVRVWSPADAQPGTPLRMLLANDGPEYDALSSLTRFSAAMIAARRLPPHRVALLAPGDRNQWYSRLGRLRARARARHRARRCATAFGVIGAPAAMGASLGGLAMLHAQRRFPRAFGALFLQSGCFFIPRYDAHERGFSRYARIIRFVRETLRDGQYAIPVPDDDHRRARGGERAQQSRNGACPGRSGVRRVPGGGAGHAQLRRLAGCFRPASDRAAASARGAAMNAHHHELYSHAIGAAGHRRRLRPLRPPGARVPVRGRARPTTGRTTA